MATDSASHVPTAHRHRQHPRCPRCGGPLERVRRQPLDRAVSLLRPVRRYRCSAVDCGWTGVQADRIRRMPASSRLSKDRERNRKLLIASLVAMLIVTVVIVSIVIVIAQS